MSNKAITFIISMSLQLVGAVVLVTQIRGGESFHLSRSSSNSDSVETTLFSTTNDSTEHAKNLNTSTEDGLEIKGEDLLKMTHPAAQQNNAQTTNNTTELPVQQEDDYYYDDYSWDDGPAEFVDLDAIHPTSIDRTPVTGLFKLAHSNDWVVVDHYYMDHYYFGNLGAGLTAQEYFWQPVEGGSTSVDSESVEKLDAAIKTDK